VFDHFSSTSAWQGSLRGHQHPSDLPRNGSSNALRFFAGILRKRSSYSATAFARGTVREILNGLPHLVGLPT
jgi:hypothetical protein